MSELFSLDGDTLPGESPAQSKPATPVQLALFAAYTDIQRKPVERYREPTLMDWLAENK